ncbi:MAG TPA: hypothetical protein VFS11_05835 [Gemmatimonadales bacterium]|nr:hypothetical protein [Gemmatimonadales bacterium]
MSLTTTVTAADLTSPTGELDRAVLFPADSASDFAKRLNAYLADGERRATTAGVTAQATFDAAVTAWAYHRAYDAKAQALYGLPATSEVAGEGSAQYLVTQMNYYAQKAADKLAEYESATSVTASTSSNVPPSASLRTRVTGWGYGGGSLG